MKNSSSLTLNMTRLVGMPWITGTKTVTNVKFKLQGSKL